MSRAVEALVKRNMIRSRVTTAPTSRPPAYCPQHPDQELEGGHVQYRCPCGHRVQAADLNREVTR